MFLICQICHHDIICPWSEMIFWRPSEHTLYVVHHAVDDNTWGNSLKKLLLHLINTEKLIFSMILDYQDPEKQSGMFKLFWLNDMRLKIHSHFSAFSICEASIGRIHKLTVVVVWRVKTKYFWLSSWKFQLSLFDQRIFHPKKVKSISQL